MQKPSIPKGTRDFSPLELLRRKFIFNTIEEVFQRYGYLPVETPAMENLTTLLGKYGEEGDKLLFKVLNSGDYLKAIRDTGTDITETSAVTPVIAEKGLRYDLTVPFARYVVQHLNEVTFPFKRYQIQPVWRADKPQRGRYREFYQCDVDVVGSDSLLNELELIQIIDDVFRKLNVRVEIRINNRKILAGLAEAAGEPDKMTEMTVALDKLDKIGNSGVREEWYRKGLDEKAVSILEPLLDKRIPLERIKEIIELSETGMKGIQEIHHILDLLKSTDLSCQVQFDVSLARGLNYYTGTIIEVQAQDVEMGSICGGGRYDNLTGVFGLKGVSGVGISFGADRIYDVMNEKGLFSENEMLTTEVMFVNFGDKEEKYILPLLKNVRESGIHAELYPDQVKIKKQMAYANNKKIPFVAIIGENEIREEKITLKDMVSGQQTVCNRDEIVAIILDNRK